MRLIKKIIINEKETKMFLLDDNKTIQVVFDNEIVSSSEGTWSNIEDEEWAQYGLLKIEVESYLKKKNSINKLKRIAEEVF